VKTRRAVLGRRHQVPDDPLDFFPFYSRRNVLTGSAKDYPFCLWKPGFCPIRPDGITEQTAIAFLDNIKSCNEDRREGHPIQVFEQLLLRTVHLMQMPQSNLSKPR